MEGEMTMQNKSVSHCPDCGARMEGLCSQDVAGKLKNHDCPGDEKVRIKNAANALNDCPLVNVDTWCEYGQEHFHPDCGEYWKPAHILVSADMDDLTVLTVLSNVMDEYSLEVHDHHGIKESGDDWARIVAATPEGDSL